MKFRIKYLLFFPLIFIVNAKPFNQADYPSLYNNRILNHNYGGFINTIQHVDNNGNVPLVHYGNIMNNQDYKPIKYANFDANKGGIYAVQDAGMKNNRQSLDKRNEILEPSENTFYDINELYTPLVSIYRSYPVDLYQQQLINDIEHHLFKPEQSRLLDALFSIESVPFPNPLIFLSEPSPSHQHSSVNIPTQNLRRFSFQMPAFPSFGQSFSPSYGNSFSTFHHGGGFPTFPQSDEFSSFPQSGGIPSFSQGGGFPSFPDMDNLFKNQFDSKKFMPEVVQDSMKDKNGNSPDLIQIGKNNKNIKSSTQHGIVQISRDMRKNNMPIVTTELPDVDETTALSDETTTFLDETIDRIDENLKESLVGK